MGFGTRREAKGHTFNAALLYASAAQTANRGPNVQISGQPPFYRKSGNDAFKILNVGPIAVAGKIYVTINDEVSPWKTNAEVDGWNKNLIAYFKHRFPEYSSIRRSRDSRTRATEQSWLWNRGGSSLTPIDRANRMRDPFPSPCEGASSKGCSPISS